jgi:O-antigen/teichoic acid export membrane protein
MSIRRAAFWSMGSQYIGFIIQFAVSVIISRFFLDPAEVGLFSIGLTVAMMVAVLQDFGISRYLIGQSEIREHTLRTATSLSCVFSILVAGLIVAVAWPVSVSYHEPRLFWMLLIIAASYIPVPWTVIPAALITRDMDFKNLFKVNVGGVMANAVTGLTLAYMGFSAESLAYAAVAQALVRACVAQYLRPVAVKFPLRFREARSVVEFGSTSSVLAISGAIGVRSPDLIIGHILGFAAVGLYSRASSLAAQLHMLVMGAITGIFYPAFARLRDDGKPFGPHYERVVAAFGAVVWPSMALLSAAAYPLISFLFGDKWAGAAPLLTMLALSEMAFVMLPLHVDLPILLGRFKMLLAFNITETVASIATLYIAAHWGIWEAAFSRIIYGALWFAIYAPFLHRLIGFRWSVMITVYLKSALLSGLTVTPLLLTYQLIAPAAQIGFLAIIPAVAAGGLIWIGALFILRHPARQEVKDIFHSLLASPVLARWSKTAERS